MTKGQTPHLRGHLCCLHMNSTKGHLAQFLMCLAPDYITVDFSSIFLLAFILLFNTKILHMDLINTNTALKSNRSMTLSISKYFKNVVCCNKIWEVWNLINTNISIILHIYTTKYLNTPQNINNILRTGEEVNRFLKTTD